MNILLADSGELSVSAISLILRDTFPNCNISICHSWDEVRGWLSLDMPFGSSKKVDLILLEILMPTRNPWYELLEAIVKRFKHVPVCVISDSTDKSHLQKAFEAGAKGYLFKKEGIGKLKTSLSNIHEGKFQYPKQLLQPLYTRKTQSILTLRQQEVLSLVAEGYPNKTIAEKLDLTEYTVKRHVYNICKKLNAKNRVEAINIANVSAMLPKY
ncbi:response regulator transcription factor [Candidatus Albibeggiatoa sp. nov. NOAA]|uniref:response regulator transcription factor n=1 Tax=Candidatus Albibeggiatoa sp. nov. NOAA TaxID=3162724 RepID=UPI0032F0F7B1|nr:response regulator transcription factor [Thiotrichaceae bacterium]